jgi:hypothetical protein
MTLKEKFHSAYVADSYSKQYKNYEKIVDDFAIGFAEWACTNNYFLYRIPSKDQEQLLEKYKKEKGL